jgi:acetylornithine deacetylase/succinyl-diaminopimelate desuccinylase-like protein
MRRRRLALIAILLLLLSSPFALSADEPAPPTDWEALDAETLRHFQALVQVDSSGPPTWEKPAADYLRTVLEAEGIETKTFFVDPNRPNLIARIRGNGTKRPLLLMAHTDVVNVDPKKWKHPPFSATIEGGHIYGRGTVDDKDNVTSALMTMLLLKRNKVELDRDVIFLAEAGEEAQVEFGIEFLVREHFAEIDAEFCLAEGGGITRSGSKPQYGSVQTTEKIPNRLRLTARGKASHGSVPVRSNAVVHLARAIANISDWQTPMRLNETTRAFFQRLAEISPSDEAARYRAILAGDENGTAQEHFAEHKPQYHSVLRTSIAPTMLNAGYRVNVIPSEAEATLDIRALPDEDIPAFIEQLKKVIDDPTIEITRAPGHQRPGAPPSSIHAEPFEIIEGAIKNHYGVVTLPAMSTGATDMSFLRAKGIQCYGIGPMTDIEDLLKGFGAHSDQERILEEALYKFVRFQWDVVLQLAAKKS